MVHNFASRTLSKTAALEIIVACLCIILRLSGSAGTFVAVGLLCVYALKSARSTLWAYFVIWLITSLNPGIAPPAVGGGVLRYLVFFSGIVSVFLLHRKRHDELKLSHLGAATVAMSLFILAHSLLFSAHPMISILKAVLWTSVFATTLTAWRTLTPGQHRQLAEMCFVALSLLMLISWLLVMSPLGYTRNGRGFQGALNHPQNFGTIFGVFAAWAFCRVLALPKSNLLSIAIFISAFLCVFLSQARTAGFAMLLGVVAALLLHLGAAGTSLRRTIPGLYRGWVAVPLILMAAAMVLSAPAWISAVQQYLIKGYAVNSVADIYNASRGALIDQMWANIVSDAFAGIGFGVPSDFLSVEIEVDPFFGIPISLPIEKGVQPLAVLEETGMFGLMLFLIWIAILMIYGIKRGLTGSAVIFTSLLVTLGEAVLFSVGGVGLFLTLMLGMSLSGPIQATTSGGAGSARHD